MEGKPFTCPLGRDSSTGEVKEICNGVLSPPSGAEVIDLPVTPVSPRDVNNTNKCNIVDKIMNLNKKEYTLKKDYSSI